MKTPNTIITTIALLIGTSFGYAQSSALKNPVSLQLKNGTTLIVAENQATPKVYVNLSFEAANKYVTAQAAVQEVVTTLLNQELTALDAGLSYSDKGINLATTTAGLETALQTLYTYINAPEFTQKALDKAKATVLAHISAQDKYLPESVNASSIHRLSMTDVNAYYRKINDPAQTFLTIVGNITPAAAKSFAKRIVDQSKSISTITKTYLVANY